MRSTMVARAAAAHHPPAPQMRPPIFVRAFPALVVTGCVAGIVAYIRSQLNTKSSTLDHIFAQKNDERHEEARKRIFVDREPRYSLYNVLSWKNAR